MLWRSLVAARESFVVESTLAGHGAISLMSDAKRAGYRVVLMQGGRVIWKASVRPTWVNELLSRLS